MNRLINIKKQNNNLKNPKNESKKDIKTVNKFLRTSMQKKTTKKFSRPPISISSTVINNIINDNKTNNINTYNNNDININNNVKRYEEEKDKKVNEKIKKIKIKK